MAYRAILTLEGSNVSEYRVNKIVFSVRQDVDEIGRPCTEAKSGLLRMLLTTDNVDTDYFVGWMCDPSARLNGSIIYRNTRDGSTVQRMEFSNAICVDYLEMYNLEFDRQQHLANQQSDNMFVKFSGGAGLINSNAGLQTYIAIYAEEINIGSLNIRN
jgi:hypothetical protein